MALASYVVSVRGLDHADRVVGIVCTYVVTAWDFHKLESQGGKGMC